MLHPDTCLQFISENIGYGIFATRLIPAGTITYVKDELEIELSADSHLMQSPVYSSYIDKYSYREPTGNYVIGWDLSKYMNHSCNPNTLSTGYGFEIAIRDIQAGEQVTDDYGMLNLEYVMECQCQQPGCRWRINPDDLDYLSKHWDRDVKKALDALPKVDQPLISLLDSETYRAIMHYLNTGHNYRSVGELKYPGIQDNAEDQQADI